MTLTIEEIGGRYHDNICGGGGKGGGGGSVSGGKGSPAPMTCGRMKALDSSGTYISCSPALGSSPTRWDISKSSMEAASA
jgi:hypothetical protein